MVNLCHVYFTTILKINWVKTVHIHTHTHNYKWLFHICLHISRETELTASSGNPMHPQPCDCKNLLPDTDLTPVFLQLLLLSPGFPWGPHKLSLTLQMFPTLEARFSSFLGFLVDLCKGFQSPLLFCLRPISLV